MQELRSRLRILKYPSVSVHASSLVAYRKINITPECKMNIGEESMVHAFITSDRSGANYSIGTKTFIGASNLISASSITIGSNVLISWGCWIVDHDSHAVSFRERRGDVEQWRLGAKNWDNVAISPIIVRDDAWIGFNSIILKGVTVGQGAVIAAGSVVTKSIPDYCVAAGNPARVIRQLNP